MMRKKVTSIGQGIVIMIYAALLVLGLGLAIMGGFASSWKLIVAGLCVALGSLYTLVILSAQTLISDTEAEVEEITEFKEEYAPTIEDCVYKYKYDRKRIILENGQVVGFEKEV